MNSAGERPDPDQLLATVQAEETRARRGRLRIFFGASAGVGKTYAMLEAARVAQAAGRDIVVGYVEPHGRQETERLMDGLERLSTLPVRYRSAVRHEFDLDAALRRRPDIILVDELAHSNLVEGEPRPRHAKRWQDIEELLDAGINVWTTVNVQHLESFNDLVAQITSVRQRETIPDRIFDEADEVELIDLPPDDLLARLKAGKVYHPEQAGVAAERFFRKGNLLALREIALRRTADRVDAAARAALATDYGIRPWLARDRLMVAVGPDSQAEQLVRAGKRLADALDAQWTVVYVETPELLRLPEAERNRRIDLLRLAESLGAETVTLDGARAAGTLIEYARTRKASRVLVGAPKRRGWRAWLRPSTATELVRRARGFDVITLSMPEQPVREYLPAAQSYAGTPQPVNWPRYARALAGTSICTAVGFAMYPYFELANIVMVYMLGAALAGLRLGRGPAMVAAVANILALNFCFVPPRFTFAVSDVQYLFTFSVMLIVTMVIATLMASVRQQTRVAGARERRTALLYAMSRELAATRGLSNLAAVAVTHVAEVFDSQAVILLPDANGRLRHPEGLPLASSLRGADLSIAQWVADHGQRAGLGSDTLPAAPALYLPLSGSTTTLGVLAVQAANRRRVLLPEQRHLLETFAGQIALALERVQLAHAAESSRVEAETESLRNTLLASISHDLRTPLAVIAGAGSALADPGGELAPESRRKLAQSIETRARDMSDLISNVLDLTRLESDRLVLRRDWQTIDDLLGTALERSGERLRNHRVELSLPPDLPAVHVDATLVVQLFANLFENAAKYTPPGTRVSVSARADEGMLEVIVEDDGPGLPAGDPDRLFNKFQRGRSESEVTGAGLGLAICRSIARAHGGDIRASNRAEGGARFEVTLPIGEPAE
jgi:two-component system sensor histidine kinase KdpD